MELEGMSVAVTGAASGLGARTARALRDLGALPVLIDRDTEQGEALGTSLDAPFVCADVADPDAIDEALRVATALGPLRGLVNCAGVGFAMRTLNRDNTPHDYEAFQRVISINLVGTFNCVRLAAAQMARLEPLEDGERGAIVNTSSVAATEGQIGQIAYAASKAAVAGMTLPFARDLAAVGIRVNTIAPGLIDTPIYGRGERSAALKARLIDNVPFPKRLGTADEFASLAVELLRNSYMNGATVRLDGSIRMPPG